MPKSVPILFIIFYQLVDTHRATNTNEKREQALTVGPLDFSAWPAQHSFSFVQRAAKVEIALFRNKTSLEPGDKWIQEHYADK